MIFFMIITNIVHNLPRNSFRIDVIPTAACNLARVNDQIMGHQCFNGDTTFGVNLQTKVQNGVGYLIAYFIRMPFTNRFRGENMIRRNFAH